MHEIVIKESLKIVADKLFQCDEKGHINWGWSGHSILPANISELRTGEIEFRDYVMEGFVNYFLQLRGDDSSTRLLVRLGGTNRDAYVIPHLRFYVEQAGLELEGREDV